MNHPGVKMAALKLHALNNDDRQWLLSRLPRDDRAAIESNLNDLIESGLPRHAKLIEEILNDGTVTAHSADPEASADVKDNTASREIDTTPLQTITGILKNEAEWLVAVILSAGDWAWKSEFLAGLPGSERERLVAMADTVSSKFEQNIIEVAIDEFAHLLRNTQQADDDDKEILTQVGARQRVTSAKKNWWVRLWQ